MLKKIWLKELFKIMGRNNVLSSPEALRAYSYDGTTNWIHEPDVVALPVTTEQISGVLQFANREGIPVTARGGGTNVSGGSIPIKGGIVLAMMRMNKILKVDKDNWRAVAESGTILQDLTIRLAQDGLFFPPDPQSFFGATLGGAIAENAGGPSCLKYGVTKNYIQGLEVVLSTGEVVKLGGTTGGSAAGYDLLHLFVGSEGTLGVVTSAELRLRPISPERRTVVVAYESVEMAVESVSRVFANGIVPCKIELLDNWVINSMEDLMHLGLPRGAEALLLFETDGDRETVEQEKEKIVDIVSTHGALEVRMADEPGEADRYWLARRAGFASIVGRAKNVLTEDVTVPIPDLPRLIRRCREIARKYEVQVAILGHAGDGNLHPSILTDMDDEDLYDRSVRAMEDMIEAAIELGGVLSGEHGIGLEKQRFMKMAVGLPVLDIMRKVKALLDPNNILNPGKIWE